MEKNSIKRSNLQLDLPIFDPTGVENGFPPKAFPKNDIIPIYKLNFTIALSCCHLTTVTVTCQNKKHCGACALRMYIKLKSFKKKNCKFIRR